MPSINLEVNIPYFDGVSFAADFEKRMQSLMVGAARIFLITALRRIPVRTGFLAGAFTTLEDAIGVHSAASSPTTTVKDSHGVRRHTLNQTSQRNRHLANLKKLENLRNAQRKRFKELQDLRQAELRRRTQIKEAFRQAKEERANELVSKGKRPFTNLSTHKEQEILGNIRNQAIQDRKTREKVLAEIARTREHIRRLSARVEKEFNPRRFQQLERINKKRAELGQSQLKHGLELEDRLSKTREAFEKRQILRERNFQNRIKRILTAHAKGKITAAKKDSLLENLRTSISQNSKHQSRLQDRLNAIIAKRAKSLPVSKLRALQRKFQRIAERQAEKIRGLTREERDTHVQQEVSRRLQDKISRLTAKSQFQRITEQAHTRRGLELLRKEHLKRQKADATGTPINRLNTLARVRTTKHIRDANGNIVDSRTAHRITRLNDIRQGEVITALLNRKRTFIDKKGNEVTKVDNQFKEYYYPTKGAGKGGRILKTPRSGRRFATPPTGVIIGSIQKQSGDSGAALLGFLQKQLEAAGIQPGQLTVEGKTTINPALAAGINRQAAALKKLPTVFLFQYQVNISYLSVNEIQRGWLAWSSARVAANQYINANVAKAIPELQGYFTENIAYVRGLTVKRFK